MANEEYFARLKQGVVNLLAEVYQAVASGAAYVCAWAKTWITERHAGEIILRTRQRVMAHLRSTPWREVARQYLPSLVGLGVLLLLLVFWKLPQWYAASWDTLTDPKDIAKLESDTRTTMVQAVGGIALLAGLLFTWRNLRMTEQNSRQTFDLSRQGQINDRFTKAIEQLGAADQGGRKKLEVRLGGIYALEQIAKHSPEDHHWPIMEVLTAYVRENARWDEEEPRSEEENAPSDPQPIPNKQPPPRLPTDIQAILTVLGRRTRTFGKGEERGLNLSHTNLSRADLWRTQLQGARLWGAQLQGAHFGFAQLQGARLGHAQLQGAHLVIAQLQGADLMGTQLQGADLRGAQLQKADLWFANLEGTKNLTVEQLSTVNTLYNAHLDPPLLEHIQQLYPQLLVDPDLARLARARAKATRPLPLPDTVPSTDEIGPQA